MNTNSKTGYHKLIVYQKSKDLILLTHRLSKMFPADEKFVMVPQIRRCSLSIAANLVEGYSKSSRKDFARYVDISIGSINELEFFFEISYELGHINKKGYNELLDLLIQVKKLLYKFQKGLRKKSSK